MSVRISIGNFASALFVAAFAFNSLSSAQVVVQQPEFRTFGTNTTVIVPDGGSAFLGGVDSVRFGSQSRGVPGLSKLPGVGPLFGNRARGYDISSARNYARVQIIDLREMEEDLLGAPSLNSAAAQNPFGSPSPIADARMMGANYEATTSAGELAAQRITRNVGRSEAARRQTTNAPPPANPASRARRLMEKGDALLAAGKIELATRYYEAAERASQSVP